MAEAIDSYLTFRVYKEKYRLPMLTTFEFIEEFQDMILRRDDIFIATYPKSGTHWMQEIVHLILTDGNASKLTSGHRMAVAEMVDVDNPDTAPEGGPNFRLQSGLTSPRVFTTHVQCPLLPKEIWQKQCKVIYIYRHPKDVICSYFNFCRKLMKPFQGVDIPDTPDQFNRFFRCLIDGGIEYGTWFDHILEYYQHRDKDFFHFLSYEDMKKDTAGVIRRISAFIGKGVDDEAVRRIVDASSFTNMKKNFQEDHQNDSVGMIPRSAFLNLGVTDQWRSRFTREQNEEFDEMFRTRMKDCELTKYYGSS